jgi:hypothetical protein
MREKLKKIVAYILRTWEDERRPPPARLRILPPFLLELLSYLIGSAILYQVGAYLWSNYFTVY